MIFVSLLTGIAVYWVIAAIFGYKNLTKCFKKYKNEPVIETPQHYKGFLRMDFGKWDEKTLKRRCFTHFPLTLFAMSSFLIIYAIMITLWRYAKVPIWVINVFRRTYGDKALRICMKVKEQFDPSEKIKTAILISNHVCFMDIMYFGMCFKSSLGFVSKKQVASYPVIGYIADYLQCLYIDRTSHDARLQIKKDIQQKVNRFSQDPEHNNSLIIFPEGTVSNGRSCMEFKNGAFQSLSPITLISLRYQCKQWHFSQSILDTFQHIFLALSADVTLRVKKEEIHPNKDQTVDQYRERCRSRVAQMGGFKKYDCNYKDMIEYTKLRKQKRKESKEKS